MESKLNDDTDILVSWLSKFQYCHRRFYLTVCEDVDKLNVYMAEGVADHMSVHWFVCKILCLSC